MDTNQQKNAFCVTHVLLAIVIVLAAAQLFFTVNNSNQSNENVLRDVLLQHEYDKVGGKDNYDVITQLQIRMLQDPSNPQNIDEMKKYLAQLGDSTGSESTTDSTGEITTNTMKTLIGDSTGSESTTDSTGEITTNTMKTLTEAQMDAVLSGSVTVEGNKDADMVVVEYSDLECPFCIMQSNENKIHENITAKYGDKVAFVFKNNRGVNHAGTEEKALGLFCVRKLGGDDAYVKFYSSVLGGSTTQEVYPMDKLPELVSSIGIDVDAWKSCVDSKEFLTAFNAETAEAKNFGLSGTPGTLIFNKKTGAYTTVSGALPFASFSEAIDSLMK